MTLLCLEKHLSKHKMTICSKNWGRHGPFGPPWLRLWTWNSWWMRFLCTFGKSFWFSM